MVDRAAQVEAIRQALAGASVPFFVKYHESHDAISVENTKGGLQLAFALLPEVLDQPNDFYLDVAKISFGRLLEALDHALEVVPPQGSA